MSSSDRLRAVLPADAQRAWETLAPHLPRELYIGGGTAVAMHLQHRKSLDFDFFYHENAVELDVLEQALSDLGPFAITQRGPGTLNGVFFATKVQFLHADEAGPQKLLETPTAVEGIPVAGLSDLLAMMLKTLGERGELRDYFDVMTIEKDGRHTVEEGLGFFLSRYKLSPTDSAFGQLVRALGYFDDVEDDLALPLAKAEIADYWRRRQSEVIRNLGRTHN